MVLDGCSGIGIGCGLLGGEAAEIDLPPVDRDGGDPLVPNVCRADPLKRDEHPCALRVWLR
jgi:hypothetical protein